MGTIRTQEICYLFPLLIADTVIVPEEDKMVDAADNGGRYYADVVDDATGLARQGCSAT